MCCIFGMGFFTGHRLENESTLTGIVSRFFKEAVSGGRKASGLSIMREKTVHVLRRPIAGDDLVSTDEYMDFMEAHVSLKESNSRLMSIIGHCRWPTKGRASNNLNNHPIVAGNVIGVHNGVITNDDELFESFDNVIERQARVDTEIIFQMIRHFNKGSESKTVDAIKKATPYLRGGYACGMQNTKHPYNLYLFKKSNPIVVKHYHELGVVFFGTRGTFMDVAVDNFIDYGGVGENVAMADKEGLVFNLWNNTMCRFKFRDNNDASKAGKGSI
jgi:amidophosphoribosyltransferase